MPRMLFSLQMSQPPSWPATAQLAQLTASTARSPPPQDPDAPLNLSKQRSPSPAPQMMLPRFHPYPQMEDTQYMAKEEEYNAACNSEYLYHIFVGEQWFLNESLGRVEEEKLSHLGTYFRDEVPKWDNDSKKSYHRANTVPLCIIHNDGTTRTKRNAKSNEWTIKEHPQSRVVGPGYDLA